MDKIIIKNAVKCNSCGEAIESKYEHDFKRCKCGRISIDGGKEYLKRICVGNQAEYKELSEIKTIDEIIEGKETCGYLDDDGTLVLPADDETRYDDWS